MADEPRPGIMKTILGGGQKKEEGLTLEIPISVVKLNDTKLAIILKKQITDPANIDWFIKNCLNKDAIIARIVFKDKFKAKITLDQNGYKIDE